MKRALVGPLALAALAVLVPGCARPGAPTDSAPVTVPRADDAATASDGTACLPTDGLCVRLPDGWRVVGSDSRRGPAGVADSFVALGPTQQRLELEGAPAIDLGSCSPVTAPTQRRAAEQIGAEVATRTDDTAPASWLRRPDPACAEADGLIPSPLPGRLVSAKVTAASVAELGAGTDVLAAAWWRR